MAVCIGTSGWSYEHWNGVLYDQTIRPRDRFAVYTRRFDTVELNASFYRWPPPAIFANWRERMPAGFRMSVKAPRGLTHGKRLYAPESWIARIAAGWHELAERRAVLLVQLHPAQPRDDQRLEYFLQHLPDWIPTAVELRHPSWNTEDVYRLLERRNAAYCITSGAHLSCNLRATASFVYIRLHGPDHNHLYAGSYSNTDIAWWSERIREWSASGRDVYAYFNNDAHGNAVRNAESLKRSLRG